MDGGVRDIPGELAAGVDALAAAAAETRRRTQHAERVGQWLLGLSALVLRAQGFDDSYIAKRLDVHQKDVAAGILAVKYPSDPNDDHVLREVVDLWNAARRAASPWMQVDDVDYSYQVVRRHSIDVSQWPVPEDSMDSWAREFTHQHSGESVIVYSLHRWNGAPLVTPTGDIDFDTWDQRGHYRIEFVTASGERGTVLPRTLGLSEHQLSFVGVDLAAAYRAGQTDGQAFRRAVAAVRRHYGALPSFDDARGLIYADIG